MSPLGPENECGDYTRFSQRLGLVSYVGRIGPAWAQHTNKAEDYKSVPENITRNHLKETIGGPVIV
jgi:hypothetical protein